MKEFYGNYLGLCINNNDPQKRGRVQVFIPHIMPALYENWNEAGEDIKMLCVGDNIPDSLPSTVVEKLMEILPWAESASPILGASSPGNLISQIGSAIGGAVNAVSNYFNQSPVPDPIGSSGGTTGIDSSVVGTGALGSAGNLNIPSINSNLNTAGLNSTFVQRLNGFYSEAKSLGYNVSITSGYRSTERQTQLYNNSAKDGSVAPPGSSAHEYGIAADIRVTGNGVNITSFRAKTDRTTNSDTPAFRNLLAKYGLHQPLHPSVKSSGISEHWHIEPIETNAAGRGIRGGSAFRAVANSLTGTGTSGSTASGNESSSTSGQVAAPTPHQDDTGIETDTSKNNYGNAARPEVSSDATGSMASGTLPEISVNTNGTVDSNSFRDYLEAKIATSKLNGYMPSDGAKHGIDGSAASWANYFYHLSNRESSLNVNTVGDIGKFAGNSNGLFQLSPGDAVNYGLNGGKPFTQTQLTDAATNTNAAIAIHESLVLKDGAIGSDRRTGAARYWGPLSKGWTAPPSSEFDPNNVPSASGAISPGSAGRSQSLIQNTDKHGTMAVVNINNMAKGVFTYPSAGALLWVFFREGNPLFPVYFAANYGEREWASAYRLGSDADGYKPAPDPDNPVTSTGTRINLGTGGLFSTDTTDPVDPTKDEKSLTLLGYDGSNMHFNEGYHQIFSKFDRRDSVEGDRWETTLGYKEEWVQGDSNEVCMGDVYIKIGNVSPSAVDAVTRIQQIIKECMKPVTQSTDCPETSTSTEGKSEYTKNAVANSTVKETKIAETPSEILEAQSKGLGEVALKNQEVLQQVGAASASAGGANVSVQQADRYARFGNAVVSGITSGAGYVKRVATETLTSLLE